MLPDGRQKGNTMNYKSTPQLIKEMLQREQMKASASNALKLKAMASEIKDLTAKVKTVTLARQRLATQNQTIKTLTLSMGIKPETVKAAIKKTKKTLTFKAGK